MRKIELEVDTSEIPAVTQTLQSLRKPRKRSLWQRIISFWHWTPSPEKYKARVPPTPRFDPLTPEEIEERSIRPKSPKATQKLPPLQETGGTIDAGMVNAIVNAILAGGIKED